jgi:hypothetical protein
MALNAALKNVEYFLNNHFLVPKTESNYSMVFDHHKWDWDQVWNAREFEWTIGTTPMSNLGVFLVYAGSYLCLGLVFSLDWDLEVCYSREKLGITNEVCDCSA